MMQNQAITGNQDTPLMPAALGPELHPDEAVIPVEIPAETQGTHGQVEIGFESGDKWNGVGPRSGQSRRKSIPWSRMDGCDRILPSGDAAERVLGEYMSMMEIHKTKPDFAPRPRGYGQCSEKKDTFFFICDYIQINRKLPEPAVLGQKLAEMHHKSLSPTGKFGFHVTTFNGKLPHPTDWEASWTTFYSNFMHGVYRLDVKVNGLWQEFDDVLQLALKRLIPRLLDPLTSEGRTIKPCLIHGDLWETNIGTDQETDEIYVFDACSYYAHHEKELGIWRVSYHQMKDERYIREYFQHFPPSEPQDEADDRNRLYAVDVLIMNSAHFSGAEARKQALDNLNYLIAKYLK